MSTCTGRGGSRGGEEGEWTRGRQDGKVKARDKLTEETEQVMKGMERPQGDSH